MITKTGPFRNEIRSVSLPLSGQFRLERILASYFRETVYCSYDDCCRSVPCIHGYPLQDCHDFEGSLVNDASRIHLVQLRRSSQAQFTAWFRHLLDARGSTPGEAGNPQAPGCFGESWERCRRELLACCNEPEALRESYRRFVAGHLDYYRRFLEKWLLENASGNTYLLFHEDLESGPAPHLSNLIRLLRNDGKIDENRLETILAREPSAPEDDPTRSPWYDPDFNERWRLPEIRCFSSGPLHDQARGGVSATGRMKKLLTSQAQPATPDSSSRTAVFILNHNLPSLSDSLYDSLAPCRGSDYDLFVLDNGSEPPGQARSTTHRIEENVFWGGALNWAFRFVLENRQYDSLLFLNNDLSLNGNGFVSGLRREMLSGGFQLLSPSIAGKPQPYLHMQCWYTGRTRPVRWIDMQAPLIHRMLIERIGQFDETLDYGWGQELVCAKVCEVNAWMTGVADRFCVEHQGAATLKNSPARIRKGEKRTDLDLEGFRTKARKAYDFLIQSDPGYFEPLVDWATDYEVRQNLPPLTGTEGRQERSEIINRLILLFNYRSYLEIGVGSGENFSRIEVGDKTGVDPDPACKARYPMSSDSFFAGLDPDRRFDLVFIDGLHEEEQVLRDVNNSLRHLSPGGTILVHDCNPLTEAQQLPSQLLMEWCGTTWRAWARLRCTRADLEMSVINTDWGIGVIRRGRQVPFSGKPGILDWRFLDANRCRLLNLVSVESFFEDLRVESGRRDISGKA